MTDDIELTHDKLQEYALQKLCNYWPKLMEIGPYNEPIRFDTITVHRRERQVEIFEIKTSRSDFLQDSKWKKYLDFCTKFAFVCPEGLIDPSEVPDNVGLVYIKPDDVKWGLPLQHEYVRNRTTLRPQVETDNYIKILEQIAARCANIDDVT